MAAELAFHDPDLHDDVSDTIQLTFAHMRVGTTSPTHPTERGVIQLPRDTPIKVPPSPHHWAKYRQAHKVLRGEVLGNNVEQIDERLEGLQDDIGRQTNRLNDAEDFIKSLRSRNAETALDKLRELLAAEELKVDIRRCYIVSALPHPKDESILAIDLTFTPTNPIQLGFLELVFEDRKHDPIEMPTRLIERAETYTVRYMVYKPTGHWLTKVGIDQGDLEGSPAITEAEWPKGHLHVVAGALEFDTEPFLVPTPSKPLAPDTEGSQH